MKQLVTRWQIAAGKDFVDRLTTMARSGNGFSVTESPFGLTEGGLLDFRGLRVGEKAQLRRVVFGPTDFGAALFKGVWLERCTFYNSKFDGTGFQKMSEHGNEFVDCSILKSSFREAALGYRGSRFLKCTFDCVDFSRAIFARPEFDGCAFYHCKLDGCDLNGSSFDHCRFVGSLRNVWFRGGFAHPNDVVEYGQPRVNQMVEVSFESACLRDVTFSNGCDLSSVKPPTDGHHALIAQWPEKLRNLQDRSKNWPAAASKAANAFATSNLVHARTQAWYILNRDDLEGEFGSVVASLIWESLATNPNSI